MRLAVQGAWIADNLRRLGSGAFYPLAYPTRQVEPELLHRLRSGVSTQGRVDVYVVRDGKGVHIADGEVVAVYWFPEFIRVHFMIGKVYVDELGEVIEWPESDYLVLSGGPSTATAPSV